MPAPLTRRARRSRTGSGELEGGLAVAFASGMAAEHALITEVCARRDRTSCMPADLYGGTFRLVDKVLSRWGLRLRPGRPDGISKHSSAPCETTPG